MKIGRNIPTVQTLRCATILFHVLYRYIYNTLHGITLQTMAINRDTVMINQNLTYYDSIPFPGSGEDVRHYSFSTICVSKQK